MDSSLPAGSEVSFHNDFYLRHNCYGLLYHLQNPGQALSFLSECCGKMLFLETCVSFGWHEAINPVSENDANATQAQSGVGCRPTRPWVFNNLKLYFEYVYVPKTQPNHEEFPIDWNAPPIYHPGLLSRSVFIASRVPIKNDNLTEELLAQQARHP